MKIFSAVMFLVASLSTHAMIYFCKEANMANLRVDLLKDEIRVQNENLFEYRNKVLDLSSQRSYEDGVRDGIENAKNVSYVQGYHAAISQNNPFTEITRSEE